MSLHIATEIKLLQDREFLFYMLVRSSHEKYHSDTVGNTAWRWPTWNYSSGHTKHQWLEKKYYTKMNDSQLFWIFLASK